MQTPRKLSFGNMVDTIDAFYDKETVKQGEQSVCGHCGSNIETVLATMDVHDMFAKECSGAGQQWKVSIPYCPKCESKPTEQGCVHVPTALASQPISPTIDLADSARKR